MWWCHTALLRRTKKGTKTTVLGQNVEYFLAQLISTPPPLFSPPHPCAIPILTPRCSFSQPFYEWGRGTFGGKVSLAILYTLIHALNCTYTHIRTQFHTHSLNCTHTHTRTHLHTLTVQYSDRRLTSHPYGERERDSRKKMSVYVILSLSLNIYIYIHILCMSLNSFLHWACLGDYVIVAEN